MIVFPNAKINLGLNVLAKRSDGFHDIETFFYPIGIHDVLEIIPSSDGHTVFTSSGLSIPGDPGKNICLQAYELLANAFSESKITPVRIHLHKIIPIGAGLGGGSSDGAFTLKMINDLFHLGIEGAELMNFARHLGSDTAFFIGNEPVFASGRGEQFSFSDLSLQGYYLILVCPFLHMSTAEAYSKITPGKPVNSLHEVLSLPVEEWKNLLVNDFEKPVMDKHPVIRDIKETLYDNGAVYASMSGSGSAVYGIYRQLPDPGNLYSEHLTRIFKL